MAYCDWYSMLGEVQHGGHSRLLGYHCQRQLNAWNGQTSRIIKSKSIARSGSWRLIFSMGPQDLSHIKEDGNVRQKSTESNEYQYSDDILACSYTIAFR